MYLILLMKMSWDYSTFTSCCNKMILETSKSLQGNTKSCSLADYMLGYVYIWTTTSATQTPNLMCRVKWSSVFQKGWLVVLINKKPYFTPSLTKTTHHQESPNSKFNRSGLCLSRQNLRSSLRLAREIHFDLWTHSDWPKFSPARLTLAKLPQLEPSDWAWASQLTSPLT